MNSLKLILIDILNKIINKNKLSDKDYEILLSIIYREYYLNDSIKEVKDLLNSIFIILNDYYFNNNHSTCDCQINVNKQNFETLIDFNEYDVLAKTLLKRKEML